MVGLARARATGGQQTREGDIGLLARLRTVPNRTQIEMRELPAQHPSSWSTSAITRMDAGSGGRARTGACS